MDRDCCGSASIWERILVLGTLIALRVPFWFLLLPLQGILIVFLFTALHECIHETAFKSSFLNTAISSISGFLILIPPVWFRFFHFAHHRHTHDPARDPELLSSQTLHGDWIRKTRVRASPVVLGNSHFAEERDGTQRR